MILWRPHASNNVLNKDNTEKIQYIHYTNMLSIRSDLVSGSKQMIYDFPIWEQQQ